jgi:primosomal protein N' (replication factor Y)
VLVGVVLEIGAPDAPANALRPITERLDHSPLLPSELVSSLRWLARYYHAPIGEVVSLALPGSLRTGTRPSPSGYRIWRLTATGLASWSQLRAGAPRALAQRLATADLPEDALGTDASIRRALGTLRRRGWIEARFEPSAPRVAAIGPGPEPTPAQRAAIDAICAALGNFQPFLLDGVTGSGKTEVYIAAIRACLARGEQALVLVPEIGLTPQALRRYGERLGVPVLSLHSDLSDAQRAQAWISMAEGTAQVLVGTRSAVFAPLLRPGLIVVDEEHDASYKQQEGVRYHARDFALVRARALGVPIVLGSATPSIESLQRVEEGRCTILRLESRPGPARAPTVRIVDVRRKPLEHGLSGELLRAIGSCLGRGEQALVFRNRRGYAPALLCHDCGWSARCRHCDAALTLHGRHRLLCHHCGARARAPEACPDCGGLALIPQGTGTERLEAALADAFPEHPVIRVDRETTRRRNALEAHFDQLGDRPGILVGTQMLAKGHDLPLLTVVAIVTVDESLYSADFRAPERMAQLLIQVAGRAGRGHLPGEVWLQTHLPEHPTLRTLLSRGYRGFAQDTLAERRDAGFPPFAHLALLRAESTRDLESALRFLEDAGGVGREFSGVRTHPALPAPMALRAGRHRAQLLLSAARRTPLQEVLRSIIGELSSRRVERHLRWSVDVDPIDLY